MAVNISSVGAAGVHSFRSVNVNDVENFVYYKDSNIPAAITTGASYIYSDGVGQITGIDDGSLVYALKASPRVLKFRF